MAILIGIFAVLIFVLGFMLALKVRELKKIKKQLHNETTEKQEKIEQLVQLKNEISFNATKDSLTGLPSRKIFDDRFMQLFHQSQRFNLIFAVLFIDLDKFRMLNAALGYEVGNQILKEAATRISNNIRKLDTVSRFGNDEFVVLLTLSKPEMSAYVAERLRNILSEPFQVNGKDVYITASFGIAVYPNDGDKENALLTRAEQALQHAKTEGPNHVQFYRKEIYEANLRELSLLSSLHSAAIYNDFEIYYQPQINIETQKMYSLEAILYWRHPEFGQIEFSDFMRFAENSGNIIAIGDWFIRNACQQFQQCQAYLEDATFTITISRRQLENPHFTYKLSQILQEMQINPSRLVLEISEKSIFRKRTIIDKTLSMLNNLGIKIGINHFGAGNISWWELKTISIHSLKISSILIKDMLTDNENLSIIEMLCQLAKTLQVQAIAGDIENEAQIAILKKMGCVIMQGNYIKKPQLLEDFMKEFNKTHT